MAFRPVPRRRAGARSRGASPARPESLEPRLLLCNLEPLLPQAPLPEAAGDVAAAAASVSPVASAGPFDPPAPGPGVPQPPPIGWTTGLKKILYVRATFADQAAHVPQTLDSARRSMGFADAFVRSNSYGRTSFAATFTNVIVLPQPESFYLSRGWDRLRADALAAAKVRRPTSWDAADFDLDVVRYDGGPAATNGTATAWAYTGTRGAWLRSDQPTVAMHELGHNLGLNHANLWQPLAPDAPAGAGGNVEYGNPYDVMGQGGAAGQGGDFNAYEKHFLGWLPDSAVQTVDRSGVYTILPADAPALPGQGQFAALRLRKDDLRDYWLSARSDSYWADNASLGGLEVGWGAWSKDAVANSNAGSQLLDMTPQAGLYDYGLPLGHTFTDAVAGIHVTPLRRAAGGAVDVAVRFDADQSPPDQSAPQTPQISAVGDPYADGIVGSTAEELLPYPVVTAAGREVTLTATSRDADGDDLAYAWDFGPDAATGATGPGGLATALSDGTLATPAATTRFDKPGLYRVRMTFSDLRGRTSSSSVLVHVTGGSAGAAPADNVITGRVLDAFGRPLADVRVGDAARWTFTDSDGTYALAGLGDADVSVAASKPGGWSFEPVGFDNPLTPSDFSVADFRGTPAEHSINGVVRSLAGLGVADVLVSDGTRSTLTDGQGHFSLPVPDGLYHLSFDKPGYPIDPPLDVSVDGADEFVQRLAFVDDVKGSLRGIPAGATAFVSYGTLPRGQQAFGGRYTLSDVPRGTWAFVVAATTAGRRPTYFQPVGRDNPVVVDGRQGAVDFEPLPLGKFLVTGHVTGVGGDGLAGVTVTATDKVNNRVAGITVTDDSGRYVLPALPAGAYSVTARQAGLNLAPLGRRLVLVSHRTGVDFHLADAPDDLAPTFVGSPAADTPVVTGTSAWLSAEAEDDRDGDRLTYAWGVVSAPPGGSVIFSQSGNNAARRTLATFDRAGVYEIEAAASDTRGGTTAATVTVTVAPVLSSVRLDVPHETIPSGTVRQYRALALDQFGRVLPEAVGWSWEAVGAVGSVAPDGTFTAAEADGRGAVVARAVGSTGTAVGAATVDVKHHATVVDRWVFYNGSVYDDLNPAASDSDLAAVATDKRPLLPGDGAATAANYTAYGKGINGIIVDLDGAWATQLSLADFTFQTGGGDGGWVEAPRPREMRTTTVAGDVGPLRRVTLVWEDGAVRDQWLRVTVLPTVRTGLAAPDLFAFGNLAGDTGDAAAGAAAEVTDADVTETLKHRRSYSTPDDPFDHDRNYFVNDADADVARRNRGAVLRLITGEDVAAITGRRRRPDAPGGN
jgi:hypothetical protein